MVFVFCSELSRLIMKVFEEIVENIRAIGLKKPITVAPRFSDGEPEQRSFVATMARNTSAQHYKHGLKASISRSNTFNQATHSRTRTLKDSIERFAMNGYLNITGRI